MNKSSAFACLLGLTLVLQSFTTSTAAAVDDLCTNLGNFYVDKAFCLSTFKRDPRSATADLQGLSVIVVDLMITDAKSNVAKVEDLLKTASDPGLKRRFRGGLALYTTALQGLEWSKQTIAGGQYYGPKLLLSFATRAATSDVALIGDVFKESRDFEALALLAENVVGTADASAL